MPRHTKAALAHMPTAEECAWKEARTKGLGGSDMPIILGFSEFKTPRVLWAEKLGFHPEPDSSPVMQRGQILEPVVRKMYSEVTGRRCQRQSLALVHPRREHLRANIDGWVHDQARPYRQKRGVLEIKCPGTAVYSRCVEQGVIPYYVAQLQHYLGMTKATFGSLCIFSAERWEMLHFDMDRDDEFIEWMWARADEFWKCVQDCVEPPTPPEYVFPEFDGSVEQIVEDNEPGLWAAVHRLAGASQARRAAESEYEEAKGEVEKLLGEERQAVRCGAVKVLWKWQEGSRRLDEILLRQAGHDPERFKRQGLPQRPMRVYVTKAKGGE